MSLLQKIRFFVIMLVVLPLFFLPVFAETQEKNGRLLVSGEESLQSLIKNDFIKQEGRRCFLQKPLDVQENGIFTADGADCAVLYLYPEAYIRITGEAYFYDIRVTSWDPVTKKQISLSREKYYTKRPHVYTKYPAKYVHIENSEFSHLGYYNATEPGSTWGVSFWGLASGTIKDSKFHDNYFGLYAYEATDVTIENCHVYHNLEYGLDFHDYTDNFLIKDNTVYANGNHGIIFSKYCDHNRIIGNLVYDHTLNAFVKGNERDYGVHGIMLHKFSNDNLVRDNELRNNRVGIFLYKSDSNQVVQNIIHNDMEEGIYIDRSNDNIIRENIVLDTKGYGLYVYNSTNNKFEDNYFENYILFKGTTEDDNYRYVNRTSYVPENFNGRIYIRDEAEKEQFDEQTLLESSNSSKSDTKDKPLSQEVKLPPGYTGDDGAGGNLITGNAVLGKLDNLKDTWGKMGDDPNVLKFGFMIVITVLAGGMFLFELVRGGR